jgi:hypothetical protein
VAGARTGGEGSAGAGTSTATDTIAAFAMTSAAARQRRHRERERDGRLAIMVEVDAAETIELLVAAGLLDARKAFHDRADIGAAVARFLELACRA